ncbi:MAG: NIL domain-containing protein, partial [Syntrophobacterales bacterium]
MLVLRFSKEIVNEPIIANLVRDYDLTFNILKATVYPRREGMVVMELQGKV